MQIFNVWPDNNTLDLPDDVTTALFKHLSDPFQTLAEAKTYWLDNNPTLIIIDQQESIDNIEPTIQHMINMALTNPEYTEEIIQGYSIKLAILNDAGDGVYCLCKSSS